MLRLLQEKRGKINLETQISESNVEESNVQQSSDPSDEKKMKIMDLGTKLYIKRWSTTHLCQTRQI